MDPSAEILHDLYVVRQWRLDRVAKHLQIGVQRLKALLAAGGISIRERGYNAAHAQRHPRPSKDDLRRRYIDERQEVRTIAEADGVETQTVYKWLHDAGIELEKRTPSDTKLPSDDDLRRMYVREGISATEIGRQAGVSTTTVIRRLNQANITRRIAKEELRRLYVDEGMRLDHIGADHYVGGETVRAWLVEDGVKIRNPGGQPGAGAFARPPPELLQHWYQGKLMSVETIAALWDVSPSAMLRWITEADIPRRPPGRSLEARGLTPPSADELREMVWVRHLSYEEIAAKVGCDLTAVGFWLDKHGIPRPDIWETRRKGADVKVPSQAELAGRYAAGESLKAISDDFDVSWQTIRELAIDSGIQLREPGWYFGPRLVAADGHLVRSAYEKRVDDWLSSHGLEHEVDPPVPFKSRWLADFRVGDTYIEVWGVRDQPTYDTKKRAKIEAYTAHGVKLIELAYHHFPANKRHLFEQRLGALLQNGPVAPRQLTIDDLLVANCDDNTEVANSN